MSEIGHHFYEHSNLPELATVENITDVLEDWVENPTGNDPIISAFGEAASLMIRNHADFRGSITNMLEFRQEPAIVLPNLLTEIKKPSGTVKSSLTKEHAANLVLRAVQHEMLRIKEEIDYPAAFTSADAWIQAIDSIYRDSRHIDDLENTRRDSLDLNLSWRIVQTNIPERYKGVKLGYAYYKEHFPKPINALEIGSSLQTGWTKLLLGDYFKNLEVIGHEAESRLGISEVSTQVNNAINQIMPVGYVIGNDLFHPRDPNTQSWVRSQFRPSEYLNPTELAKFDRYVNASHTLPYLDFVQGDFSVANTIDRVESKLRSISDGSVNKFDVISIFTTLYECTPDEAEVIIKNAISLLDENGMIIFQEPLELDNTATYGIRLMDNFRVPGAYKAIAWRPYTGEDPVLLASYTDGRCSQAEIPDAVLAKITA